MIGQAKALRLIVGTPIALVALVFALGPVAAAILTSTGGLCATSSESGTPTS